ncbi:hypothetical protein G9444_0778 [Rhodococcus erythropolis]|uniref:Uncharacterized protein n=1 Tax=Rhodococcus erythropolis TaxID=1833 RepID=A0A6G9CMD0_RHOER|nr:hypothetical protein [Rhodococcus erythropolis]QIP38022.1 hypothetical protein G9444_0778 [Rhodococcus erythropolis]
MAPSGEHRPEKLGQAEVRAAAIATGNAAAVLRERVTSLSRVASGRTVNEQLELITQQAGIAETMSTKLGIVADALKIREDAARAWNRDAPKDSEIRAAEEAVAAAKQKLRDASRASGDTSAASTELENAQKRLGELRRKRRDADAAYDKAEEDAQKKLGELEGGGTGGVQSGDHGRVTPGPGGTGGKPETSSGGVTAPGAGSPRPSGENGKRDDPSKKATGTGAGASKPSAAPSATPSSTKPAETEGSTATPESAAALAALLGQQQQPQAQQAAQPTAQATPTASAPVASTPQQGKEKDTSQAKTNPLDKILGSDGILDTGDLPGLGVALSSGSAPTPATSSTATPAASITPTAPAPATPSTTGLSASATANQQPATSGTSATGLQTGTDVSGRAGEPRSAFSPAGPETKTSGATGTNAAGAPAHAAGTRPMGGAGMPMMPMGAMGGPGGGGKSDKDREQTQLAAGSEDAYHLHGRHAVDEAVPWGTIARNDGRRSGPQPDAA